MRHFLDRDDVGLGVERIGGVDHLRETASLVLHQNVREQQREGFVSDQFAGAPHRMAEAQWRLLAGEARRARLRQVVRETRELGVLAALGQRDLQLELAVEVVLDHALVAAGDENQMLDAGLARLVDDVLDQRPVDHRQHFLRHGFGRRQEAGSEARHGKNRFADAAHAGRRSRSLNRQKVRSSRPQSMALACGPDVSGDRPNVNVLATKSGHP